MYMTFLQDMGIYPACAMLRDLTPHHEPIAYYAAFSHSKPETQPHKFLAVQI